jgi:hypothetical protein
MKKRTLNAYGASGILAFVLTTGPAGAATASAATTTWTTLASSANPSPAGQSIVLTATVRGTSGGTPTGTVTFKEQSVVLGTGTVDSQGRASLSTAPLALGTHRITAAYSGDANFSASTSAVLKQAAPTTTACGAPTFYWSSGSPLPSGAQTEPADFNNDGKPDVAGSSRVYFGDGSGTFTAGPEISTGQPPGGAVSGDWNGDGKADLIFMSHFPRSATDSIHLMLGDGLGGFQAPPAFAGNRGLPGVLGGIQQADFNLDGKLDIAVGSNGVTVPESHVTILLGDGAGGWTSGAAPKAFEHASRPLVADFNLDGRPDVARLTGEFPRSLSVYLGDGAGGFASPLVTPSQDRTLADIGDFNLDGRIDLVSWGDGVHVLLGDGSGGFALGYQLPDAQFVPHISGDFNSDGKLDIVVGSPTRFGVLLGNGAAGFTLSDFPSSEVLGVASDDFNLDGRPDLSTVGSSRVFVLLNACGAPATTTTLTVSPSPSAFGQAVTLTATVAPSSGSGTPAGRVEFRENFGTLATSTLSGGVATFTTSALATGAHSITASYSGDAGFGTSASNPVTHNVLPGLNIDDPSLAEGHTGGSWLAFAVTLSVPLTSAVSVDYAITGGTAVSGVDYTPRSGTLTFPPGRVKRHILINVVGNTTVSSNRTVVVTLTNPSGAALAKAQGTGTITEDDPPAALTVVPQYRLYSRITLEHHYTTDANEYHVLGTTFGANWQQEGKAYSIFRETGAQEGIFTVPLYRLYHPGIRQHHWTTDSNEVNVLSAGDWEYEYISGYVLPSLASGTTPLYRLSRASPPLHLWTTDANEKNVLSTPQYGWVYEGIVGYVVP